jgi:glucokinase
MNGLKEAYAAEAGNMARRLLPFGGVYVAGGIALNKLSRELARIPIYIVLNEDVPALGVAHEALAAVRS